MPVNNLLPVFMQTTTIMKFDRDPHPHLRLRGGLARKNRVFSGRRRIQEGIKEMQTTKI